MATNDPTVNNVPSAPNDLPPPYSAVVGNPPYGFVAPVGDVYPQTGSELPKYFSPPGVYPHPSNTVNISQPQAGDMPPAPPGMAVPVGIVLPAAVGSEPTTVTCYNCGKIVTTRVTYTTAWHTHLAAGSLCIITM